MVPSLCIDWPAVTATDGPRHWFAGWSTIAPAACFSRGRGAA